jgi:hypothetical protein
MVTPARTRREITIDPRMRGRRAIEISIVSAVMKSLESPEWPAIESWWITMVGVGKNANPRGSLIVTRRSTAEPTFVAAHSRTLSEPSWNQIQINATIKKRTSTPPHNLLLPMITV